MAVNLSPYGGVGAQFLDNSGNVLTGGKIFTYAAGTTTPQVTYTSSNGGIPHPNPIILDAAGRVPSGEIWLTDGLAYKFALKDANDVLIATYDNVSGINSNFVAFTNQQEIQTATAGQTVFNLITMSYQPGTNSLSVFVDGVNQYGPGAQYAYLETDSDTVTFVNGLHVGAEVKFTTSQLNSSGLQADAFQVSYTPPFTASVTTNVGDKLAQMVSVKDFGAVGDGVADDTAAIQAAVNAMPTGGGQVYIPSGTYKLTAPINIPSNKNGGCIFGDGDSTILQSTNGLTAIFLLAGQGYYRFAIETMRLNGNNVAGIPAFDCSPSVVTNIVAGAIFNRIRITNFIYGWKLKNAQLDIFTECNFDGGGVGTSAVFYVVPDSGTGQQCNANRVHHLRVTGPDVHTILTVLPTNTERATNWLFDSCDFQQSGNTITPITIIDSYYTVTNCEFENYTGNNLIEVRSDNLLAPVFTKIENNILAGGGAGGNGKILLNRTGIQWIQYTIISQNEAGSASQKLCDSTSRYTLFMNNVGTINDTAPQYNMFIGGSTAAGFGDVVGFETQNRIVDGRKTFPYDGNLNFDASLGNEFVCTVTGSAALAMNAPTNPRTGQRITIRFRNTSGGAMGIITWNAVFKLAAWTNPANGFSRSIDFDYDGTNWIEVSRTPADVPN